MASSSSPSSATWRMNSELRLKMSPLKVGSSVCLSVCLLILNPPFAHSELRSVGVKRELGTNESVFRSAATLFTKSKDVKQGIQLPVYAEFRYPKFIELT